MGKGIRWLRTLGKRLLVFLIEDISFFAYFFIFLVIVMVFGVSYFVLTPMGHGIGANSESITDVSFGNGIYFSIVTFSSLGYGDMHPMGLSKILASAEVLIGLALIGIMIAKVTSRRLSHHVLRLFASDAQRRLDEMAAQFNLSQDDLTLIMEELGLVYQATPGRNTSISKDKVLASFRTIVSALNARSTKLTEYLSYELEQGNYFLDAPMTAVNRVGDAVDNAFMVLGQVIISLSPQTRTEVLDKINREHILEAVQSQRTICQMVQRHATAEDMINIFGRIQSTCDNFPENYFAVPEYPQPDQELQSTDEPQ